MLAHSAIIVSEVWKGRCRKQNVAPSANTKIQDARTGRIDGASHGSGCVETALSPGDKMTFGCLTVQKSTKYQRVRSVKFRIVFRMKKSSNFFIRWEPTRIEPIYIKNRSRKFSGLLRPRVRVCCYDHFVGDV